MFRKMRRCAQELEKSECEIILKMATSGILALSGDDGYPYAVPLSYVYCDDRLYFHCAKEGHKIDAVKRCDKASFCVVEKDDVVPDEYTTYFRSVIVFGRVRIMEKSEIKEAVEKLALKYAPNDDEKNRESYIEKDFDRLCMIEMTLEHITGKEAIELRK